MNKNQNKAFWILYIGFLVVGTISIYFQGAFDGIGVVGVLILLTTYLIVAYAIHKFIEKNPETIEKWFQ